MAQILIALALVCFTLIAAQPPFGGSGGPGGRKPAPPPFHKVYSGCKDSSPQLPTEEGIAGIRPPPPPMGNPIASQIFMAIMKEKFPRTSTATRPTEEEIKAKIAEGCTSFKADIEAFLTKFFADPSKPMCNLNCLCGDVAGSLPATCGTAYNPRPF